MDATVIAAVISILVGFTLFGVFFVLFRRNQEGEGHTPPWALWTLVAAALVTITLGPVVMAIAFAA